MEFKVKLKHTFRCQQKYIEVMFTKEKSENPLNQVSQKTYWIRQPLNFIKTKVNDIIILTAYHYILASFLFSLLFVICIGNSKPFKYKVPEIHF